MWNAILFFIRSIILGYALVIGTILLALIVMIVAYIILSWDIPNFSRAWHLITNDHIIYVKLINGASIIIGLLIYTLTLIADSE